jgi:uncharacterized protein
MKEFLYQMNPWWEEKTDFLGIPRKKYLQLLEENTSNKDIILLTGLRRIGKTTILKQHIYNLLSKEINPKRICYISLDIYALNNFSIQEIIQEVRKIHGFSNSVKLYLFLDEVTSKESFRQELKNIYDLGNGKVFASSSSASLLTDQKAYLTGRARTIIVNSLDFREFLQFRKIDIKKYDFHLYEKYFADYMQYGGIPEYVLTKDPTYVNDLIENIISKDIIAAYGLKKPKLVKELFILLCERVGKVISYNKLAKLLGLNKDSIKDYIHYFEKSYLFYIVEKRGKPNVRLLDGKKFYCSDVGIRNVVTGFRDKGAIFENLVYLKIINKNPSYVNFSGIEIDFFFDNTLLEAKYNAELNEKQKKVFDNYKAQKKIIAHGVDFFLE